MPAMFVDENEVPGDPSSPSSEYKLPLHDIGTGSARRSRTFSRSSAGGSRAGSSVSLDEFFATAKKLETEGMDPVDLKDEHYNNHEENGDNFYSYKQQLPFPDSIQIPEAYPNSDKQHQNAKQGPHATRDAPPVQPSRQRRLQSVSFDNSVASRTLSHDSTPKSVKENGSHKTDSSHSKRNKNRSMEIRMNGHVLELTQTESGEKVTTLRHTPPDDNVNGLPTPPVARKQSLSWDDSEEGMDYFEETGNHLRVSPKKYPGPSSVDSTDDSILSGADHTAMSSSSLYDKLSWKNQHHLSRDDKGNVIKEGNPLTSVDESDASNTTGTRFGIAWRFRDTFNFRVISLVIVKWMPCFWLCCFKHNNELHGSAFPDRFILARLNILSFIFSAVSVAATLWLCIVLFLNGSDDDGETHRFFLWNNNGSVAAIGSLSFILLLTCFWTIRIVKEVDLVGALRFLWLLLWILPIAGFLNITAFDYNGVTGIWIRHYWNGVQLWWFRQQFCSPGTADTLCTVPIGGGADYDSENEWCLDQYNTTKCSEIRDEAQNETTFFLLVFYRTLASWGCAYMFVMFLTIKCLERIISKPMVQKSREVNVVGWLTFPVVCTAVFGAIYLFSPHAYLDSLNEQRWGGNLYLIASGLFLLALLMGWFLSACSIRSNTDKQKKSTAALILIGVLFINAIVLVGIFVLSLMWSYKLELTDQERGNIACAISDNECTNCDAILAQNRCPEWSEEDITEIVRRQLKQSATLAAIFILYDVNVMMHGLNLRKHLSMYQIDYV